MPRGRGTRSAHNFGRALSPERWLEQILPEVEAGTSEACLAEFERLLKREAPLLAPSFWGTLEMEDHGDHPHRPAGRELEAIRWALASMDADAVGRALQMLEDLEARNFETAKHMWDLRQGENPEGLERFCRMHGLPGSTKSLDALTEQEAKQALTIELLKVFAKELTGLLKNRPGRRLDWSSRIRQTATSKDCAVALSSRRMAALATQIEPVLSEQMLAHRYERLRLLLLHLSENGVNKGAQAGALRRLPEDDLRLLSALAVDRQFFGVSQPLGLEAMERSHPDHLAELRRFAARRQSTPEATALERIPQTARDWRLRLPVCHSADDARAQARGLLRDAVLYGGEAMSYTNSPVATVAVTPAAFGELLEADPELKLAVVKAPPFSDEIGPGSSGSAPPSGGQARPALPGSEQHRLYGRVSRLGNLGEREVEIHYIVDLGIEADAAQPAEQDVAQARLSDRWGLSADQLKRVISATPVNPTDWTSLTYLPSIEDPGLPSLADHLGPDVCDHPGAAWGALDRDGPDHPDTAALSCPRCLRRRLAVVPLHRLPDRVPPAAGDFDQQAYLRQERIHAHLRGDRRSIASFEQLRHRDGLVEMRASAYAIDERQRVGHNRALPRTIADAMSRR